MLVKYDKQLPKPETRRIFTEIIIKYTGLSKVQIEIIECIGMG